VECAVCGGSEPIQARSDRTCRNFRRTVSRFVPASVSGAIATRRRCTPFSPLAFVDQGNRCRNIGPSLPYCSAPIRKSISQIWEMLRASLAAICCSRNAESEWRVFSCRKRRLASWVLSPDHPHRTLSGDTRERTIVSRAD